ncbi:MAG: hypothetical protein O3A74_03160 [archaeon]|nr:hypothetical protein [archaeon]MDA0842436.1 hypothetical protein [archaeon]
MMTNHTLRRDTSAAATELGYIFTFLLGVLLMTMFSIWAWGIETSTRERWNDEAIVANMDDLVEAVERANQASRIDNATYAEWVTWRPTEADESLMTLELHIDSLELLDDSAREGYSVPHSGTGKAVQNGTLPLAGISTIWIVLEDGQIYLSADRPQFD